MSEIEQGFFRRCIGTREVFGAPLEFYSEGTACPLSCIAVDSATIIR